MKYMDDSIDPIDPQEALDRELPEEKMPGDVDEESDEDETDDDEEEEGDEEEEE